jgi:hypothetical protein
MSAPEHIINQGDTGTPLEDTVTFDDAVNLTGCLVVLAYCQIGSASIAKSGVVVSASPSVGAATSAVVRRNLDSDDISTPGVFRYEWQITLADTTLLIRPLSAPTTEFPDRKRPTFEVVESLSPVVESDAATATATRPLSVATIAEMKALPRPINSQYRLLFVMSDENGALASYEFDVSIAADNAPSEYVLTAGGGGFRRKGL